MTNAQPERPAAGSAGDADRRGTAGDGRSRFASRVRLDGSRGQHAAAAAPALRAARTLQPGAAPAAMRTVLRRYFEGEIGRPWHDRVAHRGHGVPTLGLDGVDHDPAGRDAELRRTGGEIGCPRSVRAVGHANGSNPISVVVPCHRVIGANGALTGYGGGLERKRWLLAHEQSAGRPEAAHAAAVHAAGAVRAARAVHAAGAVHATAVHATAVHATAVDAAAA